MKKEAIGISVNGREVKIAHMYRDKTQLNIDFLESTYLKTDLELDSRKREEHAENIDKLSEDNDIF